MIRCKKIIAILIVIAMVLTLASCKENKNINLDKEPQIKTEENIREGWFLEGIPSYEGGELSRGKYNSGPGLMSDSVKTTTEDSFMQIVKGTSAEEFEKYIDKLEAYGYEKTFESQTEKNLYVQFAGAGKIIYAYYIDALKIARIIDDRSSVALNEFAYKTDGDGSTTVYQYGLYQAGNTKTTMNCGMLYVIKLADNSLFIVDGGHQFQSTDEAAEGFINFLHEITGTKSGETLNIAAWFVTHAHADHIVFASKILHQYHKEINLERVMFNFPSFQTVKSGYRAFVTTWFKHIIREYHGNAIFMKPHTGMKFYLSDMNIEVMYTHEDAVNFSNPTKCSLGNFNSTSTVLKLTFLEDKTFMILGDTDTEAEKIITTMYTNTLTFKSDIVQVAHHNFNYLRTLYKWIAPSIALVPNSYANANSKENAPKLKDVTDFTGKDNVYYEGEGTYGFQIVDNQWKLVYETEVIGGPYDGSGF